MKRFLLAVVFSMISLSAHAEIPANDKPAENPPAPSYLDLSFKNVDALGGLECLIFFRSISIGNDFSDASVNLDSVTVVLIQSSNFYTTLDLYNAHKDTDGWIIAGRAVVVVRNKADYDAWQKYLLKKKTKRDEWRKKMLEPTRVLPPEGPSP